MKNKKAFTLIELIAVLVILAIIALITNTLVMNIVKKSKNSANKRSVDGYGKAIELSIADYLMHTGTYPASVDELEVKYTGNKTECDDKRINNDGSVYLSVCKVNGIKVTDTKTDDGYYHYGKKVLIDSDYINLYGKALEQAIEAYKKANGNLPSDIESLNIEYSGKNVDCDYKINSDSTVFLTNCSVDGTKVQDKNTDDGYYHYGKSEKEDNSYKIGDVVMYNGIKFYVIEDSDSSSDYVKLLKAEILTTKEVTDLGNFEVVDNSGNANVKYGDTSDYLSSTVKQIIDAWVLSIGDKSDLKIDDTGYSARILNIDDLIDNLGYSFQLNGATNNYLLKETVPSWVDDSTYWTEATTSDSNKEVYYISDTKSATKTEINKSYGVRPVINLLKSAIK